MDGLPQTQPGLLGRQSPNPHSHHAWFRRYASAPWQSLELYRHLKVRKPNLPVRLVWYPGEGHGNRRSSARLDYSLRMMEWFDTYLMTGDPSADLPHWDSPVPEKE